MNPSLRELLPTVQYNCDISDARYAGDYTMCIYLLKMREMYRWTNNIAFGARMDPAAIGSWVEQQEQRWESLRDRDFVELVFGGQRCMPFDVETVNTELVPHGYVYGGGVGRFGKPYFFLADLLRVDVTRDNTVYISGREYARELVAPPAMSQGNRIYIRREPLRRMLWEKVEEWRWRQCENAMSRAIGCYDFEGNVDQALERMTENEIETIILHEIGEVVAGDLLGGLWEEMLLTVSRTTAEVMARAVRDHLADCLSSLPALIEQDNQASLHFYFANLSPLRKEIFPSLATAYTRWVESGDPRPLKHAVRDGHQHWLSVASRIVDTFQCDRDGSADQIESIVAASHF